MLRIITLVMSLLLLNNTDSMADNGFYLKVDMVDREGSKDSNSQRYRVEVRDTNVSYEYSYSGFPDNKNELIYRTLNAEEFEKIITYIRQEKINTSITESKTQRANGPAREIHLSLFLTLDKQTVQSEISGNYEIFRADGKITGEIIANRKYIDNVQSLLQSLKGLNNF